MLDFSDDNLLFARNVAQAMTSATTCARSVAEPAGSRVLRGTALEDFAGGTESRTTQLLSFTITFIP